jgi:hypothetical protein
MSDVTFTKLFSSITESTVWCESDQVRIVWICMLAMANKNGFVFGSVPGLANRARVPVESVREAIAKFMQPDPDSRTKEYEGRRIEEIDGGWRLLNYAKHRAIRDEEERRDYMKNLMREKRAKSVSNVSRSEPSLSQAEAEAEAESRSIKEPKRQSVVFHFSIPSLGEITSYCQDRGRKVDPQQFFDYYTSNGWKVGRNNMKDWRAAVRTWEKNRLSKGAENGNYEPTRTEKRVAKGREAILTGLGISQEPRSSDADLQDRTPARRGPGVARLLPE